MIRPFDVAHVNLNVKYRDGVGGFGQSFHDVALYTVANRAPEDRRTRAGMNHLALRLRTPEEVDQAAEHLRANGVRVLKGPLTHKEDHDRYLYFEDADGNMIELVASTLDGWPGSYSSGA